MDQHSRNETVGEDLERASLAAELRFYLTHRKRWWLGGTAVVLAALVTLVVFTNVGGPIDPFLYDLKF